MAFIVALAFLLGYQIAPREQQPAEQASGTWKTAGNSIAAAPIKNVYSGVATLDQNGEATMVLPHEVSERNATFTYQATSTAKRMLNLHIKSTMSNDRFTIAGGTPGGEIAWELVGTEKTR